MATMVQWQSAQLVVTIGSTVDSVVQSLLSAIFVWSLHKHPKSCGVRSKSLWTPSDSAKSTLDWLGSVGECKLLASRSLGWFWVMMVWSRVHAAFHVFTFQMWITSVLRSCFYAQLLYFDTKSPLLLLNHTSHHVWSQNTKWHPEFH